MDLFNKEFKKKFKEKLKEKNEPGEELNIEISWLEFAGCVGILIGICLWI